MTDASVAAAWVLPDEEAVLADLALERLVEEEAWVPSLFWSELQNVLLSAERRGRIDEHYADAAIARIRQLSVRCPGEPEDHHILALARSHRLTAYDATYLALAIREGCPLASLDRRLNNAAAVEGLRPSADLERAGPRPRRWPIRLVQHLACHLRRAVPVGHGPARHRKHNAHYIRP
ncbi:MAG: type II toxin-antitoxin system VapC family toxin [Gammaproteobacteria bacterium]|nr:type II toxin-antitoxin system VapC family toxin [Gammaproteobacteria bacterium]